MTGVEGGDQVSREVEFVDRLAARMGPYVHDGVLAESRLQRVLRSVGQLPPEATDRVRRRLQEVGVQISDDVTPTLVVEPEDGEASDDEHDDWEPPFGDEGTDEEIAFIDPTAAIRSARERLSRDRTERRRDRRLLSAQEEVGLALLMRGAAQKPLRSGSLGHLTGEPHAAAEALIFHNQRLVHSIAGKHAADGMSHEDLYQHGLFGLMRAIELYDPGKGFKFSTYATWWIRQAISRAIANESRLIRIPVHMHDRVVRVWAQRGKLELSGEGTSVSALAAKCKLTEDQVLQCLALGRPRMTSLDRPVGRGGTTLGQLLPKESSLGVPENEYASTDQREQARVLMSVLTLREAEIIDLRFGLTDGRERTLEEIGRQFGVTRERIRQIEAKAMKHLRIAAGVRVGPDE
jgi:RNA polymerase primary sigma factor